MIAPLLTPGEPMRLQSLYRLCLLDTPFEHRIVRAAARVYRVPIALGWLLPGLLTAPEPRKVAS